MAFNKFFVNFVFPFGILFAFWLHGVVHFPYGLEISSSVKVQETLSWGCVPGESAGGLVLTLGHFALGSLTA